MDLNSTPASVQPLGQTSNFEHPSESRGRATYIMAGICLTLSTLAVVMRIFTKARVLRQMHLEEYILIAAQFGLIALVAILISAIHFGAGLHQWDVSVAHFSHFMSVCKPHLYLYLNYL